MVLARNASASDLFGDEATWIAALKPTTTGVPEYRDDVREYLEIVVLRLTLRADRSPGLPPTPVLVWERIR